MFKKGQKVTCVSGNDRNLMVGNVYEIEDIVTSSCSGEVYVTVKKDGLPLGESFWLTRFKPYEPAVTVPMAVAQAAGPAGGLKFDDGKPPISLVDPEMIEGVAAVMGFGAKKYAAHNWRKGLQVARCLSGALRHILAVVRGEDMDPESGLPHIDHAICSLQFARHMIKHRPDMDDRYKGEL